jgi:hypothetical protein
MKGGGLEVYGYIKIEKCVLDMMPAEKHIIIFETHELALEYAKNNLVLEVGTAKINSDGMIVPDKETPLEDDE